MERLGVRDPILLPELAIALEQKLPNVIAVGGHVIVAEQR